MTTTCYEPPSGPVLLGMDTQLISQARRSFTKYRRALLRDQYDSNALEGCLEAIATAELAGGRPNVWAEEAAILRVAVRRAVAGWTFWHLGDAALFALGKAGEDREDHLAVRDQVELLMVAARLVLGPNCITDEALSSIDAFDELVEPTLTTEERAKVAWMTPDKRRKSWRSSWGSVRCGQIIPIKRVTETGSTE